MAFTVDDELLALRRDLVSVRTIRCAVKFRRKYQASEICLVLFQFPDGMIVKRMRKILDIIAVKLRDNARHAARRDTRRHC